MKTLEKKLATKTVSAPKKIFDNSLPDLSKHPIVAKKVEEAREFLKKHPIPEHLLRG
ncbi:hypothetical protein [Dyadobacter sp. 32]|uniref:hypothetical protein n=1 Tax=Dyadobacter sp. 32 TaxID=538966 RepID=UPI0039C6E064